MSALRVVCVALLWSLCSIAPAKAAPASARRVVVLPIETTGAVSAQEVERLQVSLRGGIGRAAVTVVPEAAVTAHLPASGVCTDDRCLRRLLEALDADFAVRTNIGGKDRVYELSIEIRTSPELEVRARVKDRCEICGFQEVLHLLADQAGIVADKLESVANTPRMLVVTQPAGARLLIDGHLVGTTPLEQEIEPGPHEIEVTRKGFIAQRRTIDAVAGVDEEVRFRLESTLEPDAPTSTSSATLLVGLGAAGVGIGVVSIAAGVPLLIMDGRQYQGQCTGMDVDVNGTCRFSYATQAGGIAAVVIGALLTAGGAVAVAAGRERKRARSSSARLTPRPATLPATFEVSF